MHKIILDHKPRALAQYISQSMLNIDNTRYELLPESGSFLHWSDGHSALSIWPSVWQQASLPLGVLQQLYDKTLKLSHF